MEVQQKKKLTKRLGGHRTNYKKWLDGKFSYMTSFEIMKYPDAKIILVESFPCSTKYELIGREQFFLY